jgi:O-antigen/teichoic acid export membrane protein
MDYSDLSDNTHSAFRKFFRGFSWVTIAELIARLFLYAVAAFIARAPGYELKALAILSVSQAAMGLALVVGDSGLSVRGVGDISRGESTHSVVKRVAPQQTVLSVVAMVFVLGVVFSIGYSRQIELCTLALSPLPIIYGINTNYVLQARYRFTALAFSRVIGCLVTAISGVFVIFEKWPLWGLSCCYWIGPLATTIFITICNRNDLNLRDFVPNSFKNLAKDRAAWSYFIYAVLIHVTSALPLILIGRHKDSIVIPFAIASRLLVLELFPAQLMMTVAGPIVSTPGSGADAFRRRFLFSAALLSTVAGVGVFLTATSLPRLLFGGGAVVAAGTIRLFGLSIPFQYFSFLILSTNVVRNNVGIAVKGLSLELIVITGLVFTPLGRSSTGMATIMIIAFAVLSGFAAFSGGTNFLRSVHVSDVLLALLFGISILIAFTLELTMRVVRESLIVGIGVTMITLTAAGLWLWSRSGVDAHHAR